MTFAPRSSWEAGTDAHHAHSWWFGDATRGAAEDLLLSLDRDSFLVRNSSAPGCYTCHLCHAATGQIDRVRVLRTSTGRFQFAKKDATEYRSLVELVLCSPFLSEYAAPDLNAAADPVANARKAYMRRAKRQVARGVAEEETTACGNHSSKTLRKPLRDWEAGRTEADTKALLCMEQLLMREIPNLQRQAEQIKRNQTQFFQVPAELKRLHRSRHAPPGQGESLVQRADSEIVPVPDGLHLFNAMDHIDFQDTSSFLRFLSSLLSGSAPLPEADECSGGHRSADGPAAFGLVPPAYGEEVTDAAVMAAHESDEECLDGSEENDIKENCCVALPSLESMWETVSNLPMLAQICAGNSEEKELHRKAEQNLGHVFSMGI